MSEFNVTGNSYNLNELYKKAFGYVAPPFPLGGIPDPKNLLPVRKLNGLFDTSTMLGAELRMPCAFRIPGEELWQLPNEPIISLRGKVDSRKTTLNRGKKHGTVKEIINLDDYVIKIQGIIYNEDEDDYPEEQVAMLRKHLEYPGAFGIENLITRIWNITLCTVDDFDIPRDPEKAFREQHYEIVLSSDEDFELELI